MTQIAAEHHVAVDAKLAPCAACTALTLWRCMFCLKPNCPKCAYSQFALCQPCKAAYVGPIWQLGKRADEFIRAELERVFRC